MTTTTTLGRPRRRWRILLGLALIAYGAAGLALAAGGGLLVSTSFRGIDDLARLVAAQRNTLVLTLDTTAALLGNAAEATESVDEVLAEAVTATREAATTTESLATAADQVASAATFQFFGQQPLAQVATSFAQVAADARALGERLEAAADALAATGRDTERLRGDLRRVGQQIGQFGRGVAESMALTAVLDQVEQGFQQPRLVLYGLLGWIAVQAGAGIIVGFALFRPPRPSPI